MPIRNANKTKPTRKKAVKKSLPTRSQQHISRKKSLEILSVSLPEHWILRSFDEADDYGIDCEIELVQSNKLVPGEFVKAQVKGREKIIFKKDEYVVSGIKQSTIRYWLGLSKKVNVFLIVTDNKDRKSYFTNVFWESTTLLNDTNRTKSFSVNKLACLNTDEGKYIFLLQTLFQNPLKQIDSHKWFLKNLHNEIFNYFGFVQYDGWVVNYNKNSFFYLLEKSRFLIEYLIGDYSKYFDYSYWQLEAKDEWDDGIKNFYIVKAYEVVMPRVLEKLLELQKGVLSGKNYWDEVDPDYYEEVRNMMLPPRFEHDFLLDWVRENKILDRRYES